MHSSRMHTARSLIIGGGVSAWGGVCQRGVSAQGVSWDLFHHAFDVTCMLPPHQLSVSTSAAAYIV